MVKYTTTPYLNMQVPNPDTATTSGEQGPIFAQQISADLINNIDGHDHSGPPHGKLITQASINITGDLSFNGYNATNMRGLRLEENGTPLTGSNDINEIYDYNGDLYFNDASGNVIRLTENGQIVAGNTNYFSVHTITTNLVIVPSASYVIVEVQSSPTSGPITIQLPDASAGNIQTGRLFIIKDGSYNSNTYPITINTNSVADTFQNGQTSYTLNMAGAELFIYANGNNKWQIISTNVFNVNDALNFKSGSAAIFETGSYIAGNIIWSAIWNGGGTVSVEGGTVITLNDTGTLIANHDHALKSNIANGIASEVAGGIISDAAGGIQSSIASGISPGVAAGIDVDVADGLRVTIADGIAIQVPHAIVSVAVGGIYSGINGGILSNVAGGINTNTSGGISDGGTVDGIAATVAGGISPKSVVGGIYDGGTVRGISASVPGGIFTRRIVRHITTNYTVDSSGFDEVIIWNPGTAGAGSTITVTLTDPTAAINLGRVITFVVQGTWADIYPRTMFFAGYSVGTFAAGNSYSILAATFGTGSVQKTTTGSSQIISDGSQWNWYTAQVQTTV
jgi:hypothetical protein